MTRPTLRTLAVLTALALGGAAGAGNWPQWRGPAGNGVSGETGLPLKWSASDGIVWKCPLSGKGASTPAVWGDAVFVTTQEGDALSLLRVDAGTGRVVWSRRVGTGEPPRAPLRAKTGDERRHQKFHALHNLASPSPVTDGEVVVAHFGNGDLAAYDADGKLLWRHNLQNEQGDYTIWWGHANSPVLVGGLVVSACVQDSLADVGGRSPSYLVAHDLRTGEQRWLTPRKTTATAEECDAYTTPVVRQAGSRNELVVMGGNQLDAYDPATGKQLWYLPGLRGGRTVTGPTVADGLVFATQGKGGPLLAVRPVASGELSADAVAWKHTQGTSDSSTPVVSAGLLFWITDGGLAHCCDARTGEMKWKERLPGDYKASPVAAEGRVYFLNRSGLCTVVAASSEFTRLAANQVGGETIASPAVAGGRIYLRALSALYCLGKK